MKKRSGLYIVIWVLLLAVFNLIAFITPPFFSEVKYTASFWIGYSLITVMLIGQLICALVSMSAESEKKMFYNLSLFKISYAGLIASFIVGGVCIILSPIAYWIGAIVCAIILVFNVIAVLKASIAIDEVEKIDRKIANKTFFIKSITVDAEALMAEAKTDEILSECRKVYEAFRYSDPMSHEALTPIEQDIAIKFGTFMSAVKANDAEAVADNANAILILLNNRNKKCKLFK